nr:hypothetical protein GCM10020093_109070 [Planobispora longispora]
MGARPGGPAPGRGGRDPRRGPAGARADRRRAARGWARGQYAAAAAGSALRPWLFMLLDGKDPGEKIWRSLCPSGDLRPVYFSEDTA